MAAIRFGAGDMLEYNARYKLLICRECQYAIQKSALESHLLRHKIYRGDRQRLLSSIAQLDLLEPHQVALPALGSPPVDGLPILPGYRCTATPCQHLTASAKRMRGHLSEVHGLKGPMPLLSLHFRAAKMQTFFRGTQLKYFEVASSIAPPVDIQDRGDDRDGHSEGDENIYHNATELTPSPSPSPPPPLPASSKALSHDAPVDLDLDTLAYFHHFITVVCLTLPRAKQLQSTSFYWRRHVVLQALRSHWLMCGLLAISASHRARIADDAGATSKHRKRESDFHLEFCVGLAQTSDCYLDVDADEEEMEARKIGGQISCLLSCVHLAHAGPALDGELMVPRLRHIMSTIRGCVIGESTPGSSRKQDDAHERQEQLLVQDLMQVSDPSDGGNLEGSRIDSSSDHAPSVLLDRLRALPSRIAGELGRPEDGKDVIATLWAVSITMNCCNVSFARDEAGAAWQGVATWLTDVPDHFNQMVSRHHPAALVVLAHWAAILVKRAEYVGCWFLQGLAEIIVVHAAKQLSACGRGVLDMFEWPMSVVSD